MKTRILHTEFWKKMAKHKAPKDARLLYNYLLTNSHINMSGIFELPDEYILLETALTPGELTKAKAWLTSKEKVFFFEGWVRVVDAENYNNYQTSPKTAESYKKELKDVPALVLDRLYRKNDTSIDSSMGGVSDTSDTNHNTEYINKKDIGVVKGKDILDNPEFSTELQELFPDKDIPLEIQKMKDWLASNGKKKSDYKAFARNWLRNELSSTKSVPGIIHIS